MFLEIFLPSTRRSSKISFNKPLMLVFVFISSKNKTILLFFVELIFSAFSTVERITSLVIPACTSRVKNSISIIEESNFMTAVLPIPVSPIVMVGVLAEILKNINAILKKLSLEIAILYNSVFKLSVMLALLKLSACQFLIMFYGLSLHNLTKCFTSLN